MGSLPSSLCARWIGGIPLVAAYWLGYLVLDWAALAHPIDGMPSTPWNAAPALSFTFLVHRGASSLPLAIIPALVVAMLDGQFTAGPLASLAAAIAEAAGCAVGAVILRSAPVAVRDLGRIRGVFLFFGAAGAAAAVLGAGQSPTNLLSAGRAALANMVAIAAIAPLWLLPRPGRRFRWPPRSPETLLQILALGIIAWEVFTQFVNEEIHFFYLLFLPCAWIATRHGQRGTALALAAIYGAPLVSDWFFPHQEQAILELQVRLVVLAATTLTLGAMASERRRAEESMLARQTELAHVQRLNIGWEMASALAHEVNQPLTAAMNYAQAGIRLLRVPNADTARAEAVMAKSIDQIERVGHIIHGLRDFMRKGEMRLARATVADLAEDALRLVSPDVVASGAILQVSGLAGMPPILADKTQIVQVLVNLTRNAAQAIASVATTDGAVSIGGRQDGNWVELWVADNGPGISPDIAARLFEPFVTSREAGMGLGLSISKSILEAHGGRLWAESRDEGGTIFRMTLPVAGGEKADE